MEMDQIYAQHEKMLWSMVHRFRQSYGGDVDDLMGEARLCFVRTYAKWDPSIGRLSTYLYRCVWGSLMDFRRKELIHTHTQALPESLRDPKPSISDFLLDVNSDVGDIIQILMDPPDDLIDLFQSVTPKPSTARFRRCLCSYMAQKFGWHKARMKKALLTLKDLAS